MSPIHLNTWNVEKESEFTILTAKGGNAVCAFAPTTESRISLCDLTRITPRIFPPRSLHGVCAFPERGEIHYTFFKINIHFLDGRQRDLLYDAVSGVHGRLSKARADERATVGIIVPQH